ncbi:uncharacterized protein LOC118224108 isoform X2 [Anguilla anguilla]|uniref:uncharacterized protein LOC118224108 isoform X2 n=1 Tax=Anguilla anguilla TaxID=7936 RepID=UPI0015A9846D|nr:uncharacterized protein LOC118224108 isoform X2 [Anguilla anguilla]
MNGKNRKTQININCIYFFVFPFTMPYDIVRFCKKVLVLRPASLLLFCVLRNCVPTTIPVGTFRTECHDHHFWLTVKSNFLGHMVRFDIEDKGSVHFLSHQRAAECGYTMIFNSYGDLVLRASFLACYVDNKKDTEFRLHLWFVNKEADGKDMAYPVLLSCRLQQPWSPRQIVCEENYMEVSVKKEISTASHQGLKWTDSSNLVPEEKGDGLKAWQVAFHKPEYLGGESMPLRDAQVMGYHINTTDTRIILRCPYSSVMSYMLQERGVPVEVVRASIFYHHMRKVFQVDVSVACTMNKATMDGEHIVGTFPQVLSPLVSGSFRDRGIWIGVDTRLLNECSIKEFGYKIGLQNGVVQVRIPFGAKGVHIKSHVVDRKYAQSSSIDLFYVHQWKDSQWALTHHLSFRPLKTLYVPKTPIFINNTMPSEKMFSVTLGTFPHDVSLRNVTIGDEPLSLLETIDLGIKIFLVPFKNGTHAYQLKVPFSNLLISQKSTDGGYRRYTLRVTFVLDISPHGEVFHHHGTVVTDLRNVVLPRLEGKCTQEGILVLLHYGNQDFQWEMYLGNRRLDWELVELGGYLTKTGEDYFSIELPLYSLGMTYEDLSLQGLVAMVEVTLVNVETMTAEHIFAQRCRFPVKELLVCLPQGKIVVLADTSRTIPPIEPNRTTLLDQNCGPIDSDSTRALFTFSPDSCGTIRTLMGNHLVYENEVRYMEKLLPTPDPLTEEKPRYRLTVQCHYPVNDTSTITISHPFNPALTPPTAPTKEGSSHGLSLEVKENERPPNKKEWFSRQQRSSCPHC